MQQSCKYVQSHVMVLNEQNFHQFETIYLHNFNSHNYTMYFTDIGINIEGRVHPKIWGNLKFHALLQGSKIVHFKVEWDLQAINGQFL